VKPTARFSVPASSSGSPGVHAGQRAPAAAGFTMIELVSALALFVVIFGILLLALNAATNLWSTSRAQRRELPSAERIAGLIADDLYQAVADPILATNGATLYNTFVFQNLPTNAVQTAPAVLLAFPRTASPRTLDPDLDQTTRLALDAVFYTTYSNAFFRVAIPVHIKSDHSDSLGEWFESYVGAAQNPSYHAAALFPDNNIPDISITLLAERVIPTFATYYPSQTYYDQLETNALPDMLDLSLHIFDTADWSVFQAILQDTTPAADLERSHLGTLISRRVTLPQAGGSRLP
jgi:hypothetical protein